MSRGSPVHGSLLEGDHPMPTYMHIDRTDVTAEKETQVQFRRSTLPFSDEVLEIEK